MSESAPGTDQWKGTVFLVGSTGVGKSELALALAGELNGEIIGADAFQVYRGMAILTAQPSADQLARIPHHLVGTISPLEEFSAGHYVTQAQKALENVRSRGKTAIFAGGSGMYVAALIHGLAELPPVPPALRSELEALPLEDLVERLHLADPNAMDLVDLNNPRRVQRAIEIILTTGRPLANARQRDPEKAPGPQGVFLSRDPEELRRRIRQNVEAMFEAGVDREVGALGNIGSTAARAIGFGAIRDWIQGRLGRDECIEQVFVRTCQYAKRQRTWFKNQLSFPERNLSSTGMDSVLKELVLSANREALS